MRKYWKFWFMSGERGQYMDFDFRFFNIGGYLHIRYGKDNVCKNPKHS